MAVLTIRNLPDEVRNRLRQRAAAAGMSMEAQARAIITNATREETALETAASLQAWVDELYRGNKPDAVVRDFLAERRRDARAERAGAPTPRSASGKRR